MLARYKIYFFVSLISFIFPSSVLRAKERVVKSSFLTWDTLWEGDILVDGIVKVAYGVTLNIAPGTNIRFAFRDEDKDGVGDSGLFIQGTINAVGTRLLPIVFTSGAKNKKTGDWKGINIIASDREINTFLHVNIEYADVGVHSHFSKLVLRSCGIVNNHRGLYCQEMDLDISTTTFFGNISAIRCRDVVARITKIVVKNNTLGVNCRKGILDISDSEFSSNSVYGLRLRDSVARLVGVDFDKNRYGGRFQDSKLTIENSNVSNNYQTGLSFMGGAVSINNSKINSNGLEGISALRTDLSVTGSVFRDNGFGVRCRYGTSFLASGCVFEKNNEGVAMSGKEAKTSFHGLLLSFISNTVGCHFTNVSPFVIENSVMLGGGEGIRAKKSSGNIKHLTVRNSSKDAISVSDSLLTLSKTKVSTSGGIGIYLLRTSFSMESVKSEKNHLAGIKVIGGEGAIFSVESSNNAGNGYTFEKCKVLLQASKSLANSASGVCLTTSVVSINKFSARENAGWGIFERNSRFLLNNGVFVENSAGGLCSQQTENSHIINSSFRDNSGGGWFCDSCEETFFADNLVADNHDFGIRVKHASPIVRNNSIINEEKSFILETKEDLYIGGNFWGSSSETYIEGSVLDVFDGYGDGAAIYMPFLKKITKKRSPLSKNR